MNGSKPIEVWDVLVRCLHWALVAALLVSLLTIHDNESLHADAGFAVLFLTVARVLWGFFGQQQALFSEFLASGSEVGKQLRGLFGGKPRRYLGNDPLGGWMVVALLSMSLLAGISGFKYYNVKNGVGTVVASSAIPEVEQTLVVEPDLAEEEYWQSLHAGTCYSLLALVALHVFWVFWLSAKQRENLLVAMLTGRKRPY